MQFKTDKRKRFSPQVALSISAGVDQSLTTDVFSAVPALVQEGRLPLAAVDRATANVLRAKFASRLFDEVREHALFCTDLMKQDEDLPRQAVCPWDEHQKI